MGNEHLAPFIQYWKGLKVDGWNENDVREDFVAPLLRFLGYAKDTVNHIVREQSHALSEAFHRVGRDRIKIDYIPTVRLKKFWIIEAKPGDPVEMDFGDFLQAYLYALHPEVQAKFIVLTNAREVRVYDVHTAEKWDDVTILCKKESCETTFPHLYDLLSAKTMLTSLRTHVLSTIRDSLDVEIDERSLDALQQGFSEIVRAARPVVKKNARDFQRHAFNEREKKAKEELENCDLSTLMIMMDIPTHTVLRYGPEILWRCLAATIPERTEIVNKLAMNYRARPHSVFRAHCTHAFVGLLLRNVDVGPVTYVKSLMDGLEELVTSNMNYWAHDPVSGATTAVECPGRGGGAKS